MSRFSPVPQYRCGNCGGELTISTVAKDGTFNKTIPVKICKTCDAPDPPRRREDRE